MLMPKIGHLSCSLCRGTKIILFASATSIRLHEEVQTEVTLQMAVCASWVRFPSPDSHNPTSVSTEPNRLFLKTEGSALEIVQSKFNVHLRNNGVRSKLRVKLDSVLQSSLLIMCRQIMAVCSQIHTKHINTVCGHNVELLNIKPGGTYSDHWAVKG